MTLWVVMSFWVISREVRAVMNVRELSRVVSVEELRVTGREISHFSVKEERLREQEEEERVEISIDVSGLNWGIGGEEGWNMANHNYKIVFTNHRIQERLDIQLIWQFQQSYISCFWIWKYCYLS